MTLPEVPGTYILLLGCDSRKSLRIGRAGILDLAPGFYLYVGSAFGPGGLASRIRDHCRTASRPHWHLDYLRPAVQTEEIWFSCDPRHREHQWAETLMLLRGASIPMPGFGATDCQCISHLLGYPARPRIDTFRRRIKQIIPGHQPIRRCGPLDPDAAS